MILTVQEDSGIETTIPIAFSQSRYTESGGWHFHRLAYDSFKAAGEGQRPSLMQATVVKIDGKELGHDQVVELRRLWLAHLEDLDSRDRDIDHPAHRFAH